MNKGIVFISFIVLVVLLNMALSTKAQGDHLKEECKDLAKQNLYMRDKIKDKELLPKYKPVPLSEAYELVLNQIKILEGYGGTSMDLQLEGAKDADDISNHYMNTEYKGVRGLKIRIIVDKFSKETDMGAVLDDIHLLERNTDFIASEITKDNNDLIVKGEVYGI